MSVLAYFDRADQPWHRRRHSILGLKAGRPEGSQRNEQGRKPSNWKQQSRHAGMTMISCFVSPTCDQSMTRAIVAVAIAVVYFLAYHPHVLRGRLACRSRRRVHSRPTKGSYRERDVCSCRLGFLLLLPGRNVVAFCMRGTKFLTHVVTRLFLPLTTTT